MFRRQEKNYGLWTDKQRRSVFILQIQLPAPRDEGQVLGEPGDIMLWQAIKVSSLKSTGQGSVTYLKGDAPDTICKSQNIRCVYSCEWVGELICRLLKNVGSSL